MSSQRKYAVSGIRSGSTNETTSDRRMRTTRVAASHHCARTDPLRHTSARARSHPAARTAIPKGYPSVSLESGTCPTPASAAPAPATSTHC